MAATITVPHRVRTHFPHAGTSAAHIIETPIIPRRGIVTLWGYGINVSVDKGHLILKDGIGDERRAGRFPRVNHGIKRLVIIGADGIVSLAAMRWLSDQNASFVMLDRDGTVLLTTGPVASSDARLRRAQACAGESELGLEISKQLITLKLNGQARVARENLRDPITADAITNFRNELKSAREYADVRTLEARAGAAYWIGWHGIRMQFPKRDSQRVPDHWLTFGSRTSPLSGFSPRLAVNPFNAILNYLYAILESETRLAIAAMGLDPGMGFLHADNDRRDSLACDVMEVVRPDVDAFLFDWVSRAPFKREWFFEQRNGNTRLMADFAASLSETAPTWRRAVAPVVEWLARTLWEHSPKMTGHRAPANRLTQSTKRSAQGVEPAMPPIRSVAHQNLCRNCGAPILHKGIYCRLCNADASKESYVRAADLGRKAALSAESQKKRAEAHHRNTLARRGWIAAEHPAWLDQETYVKRVLPRLSTLTVSSIASSIDVLLSYADSIRKGKVHPHARHWLKLAELAGVGFRELDLSRFLRQTVKSQNPANGELTHGSVSTEIHKGS